MLEQRAAEAAKIIEGTAETAALPAPETQSLDLKELRRSA
jgi:hypothetical protein